MGKALYRSHRPKKLHEVVGQEHITRALERALKSGAISHAYLLTGPRGVGKTTTARILAHEINGLPYTDDATHLDIIEIDAASNRRIDEIRDIRDKVHIAPTSAKYKVYIIDEVHMLTKEAFNALLKTLEEPPEHVVFILATTEVHKLPETIISRTQRYAFRPADRQIVTDYLRHMASKEGIAIDDDALELIAAHGEGSFRDSISLLDQVRNSGDRVTLATVQATLGIAPKEVISALIEAVRRHDAPELVVQLQAAHAGGHEPARMAKQLGEQLRNSLLTGQPALASDLLLSLLAALVEVPASSNPKGHLEVALLDAALSGTPIPATPAAEPPTPKPAKVMPAAVQARPPVQVDTHPAIARKRAQKTPDEPVAQTSSASSDATLDQDAWNNILAAIKQKHNTIFSLVNACQPHFEAGKLTLETGFAFHQKRLNDKTTKSLLVDIIQAATGHNLQINCILGQGRNPADQPPARTQLPPEPEEQVHAVAVKPPTTPATPEVAAISNIFGGAELLDS